MKMRSIAQFLSGVMLITTLAGCSGGAPAPNAGGAYSGAPPMQRQRQSQGMSTKQKLVLLSAAAAAAYFYNKHQKQQQANGGNGNMNGNGNAPQYYRSKNGRIYYRDAQGRPVWVTPPRNVQLPADQAQQYEQQAPNYSYYR